MSRSNRVISIFVLVAYLCGGGIAGATPVFLCLPTEGGVAVQPGEVDCCEPAVPGDDIETAAVTGRVAGGDSEHRCPNCIDVLFSLDAEQLATTVGQSVSSGKALPALLHTADPFLQIIPSPPDVLRSAMTGSSTPMGTLRAQLDTIVIRC